MAKFKEDKKLTSSMDTWKKGMEAQIASVANGRPFGTCGQCGLRIVTSAVICPECARLEEVGFGPVPRAPHALPGQDTQPVQSHPSGRHDGYSDTIPSGKVPPGKERV